jgi:hypothetical protein
MNSWLLTRTENSQLFIGGVTISKKGRGVAKIRTNMLKLQNN